MSHQQQTTNNIQNNATAAIAAVSNTPFKTAFKITMGIALAQLTTLVLVVLGFFSLCAIGAVIFGLLK